MGSHFVSRITAGFNKPNCSMASIRGEEAHQEGEIMRCRRSILSVLVLLSFAATQSPAEEPKPDYSRGQKMLDAYFRRRVQQISDDCLKDIRTKEEWEK